MPHSYGVAWSKVELPKQATNVCVSLSTVLPPPEKNSAHAGMRGDFLGQATVEWDDLEPGRDLNLKLMKLGKQTRGGPVKGTIKLRVGEPIVETPETGPGGIGSSFTVAPGEQKKVKYRTGVCGGELRGARVHISLSFLTNAAV